MKYCDTCDSIQYLTEDGYCCGCGKHADNMKEKQESLSHQEKIDILIALLEENINSCNEHAELFRHHNLECSQISSEAMAFAYKISIDKIREILLGTRV